MQRVFFLRAFGDFVIGIQNIAQSSRHYKIIASNHLAPLYESMVAQSVIAPVEIEFLDFGIKKGQLAFFTNKNFISFDTFYQLSKIKSYLKKYPNPNGIDFVEQEIRLPAFNFFTNHHFEPIVRKNTSVYSAYANFAQIANVPFKLNNSNSNIVIIFPDARKKIKEINNRTLNKIIQKYEELGYIIKIAKWNYEVKLSNELTYHNFNELIQLIQKADFVVSSDSLPVHLAHLIKKPHLIIYNGANNNFCTPFALEHQSYLNSLN